jgi:hypothetical protein
MQSLQGFFTYVDFKINQKEITTKYCVNKDRPKLRCNGTCFLAKQLKKQDELFALKKKENEKNHAKKIKEVEFFAEVEFIQLPSFQIDTILETNFNYQKCFSEAFLISCFHPPQV